MIDAVTVPAAPLIPLIVQQLAPIFTALALLVTAALSGYAAILSARNGRKADRIERSITDSAATINSGIAEVHRTTNGMKDELVRSTARESHAAGIVEGRAIEKANTPAVVVVVPPGTAVAPPPADNTGSPPG